MTKSSRGWSKALAWGLATYAILPPIATLFARVDGNADLFTHFQEPALVVSLIACALMIHMARRAPGGRGLPYSGALGSTSTGQASPNPGLPRTAVPGHPGPWRGIDAKVAIVLGLLAVTQAWFLFRYDWPNPVSADFASPRLRLLVANVLTDNLHRAELIQLIRDERPDVVGLIEVSPEWLADLAPIQSEYPYRFDHPAGARGLALWFRKPPISVEGPLLLDPRGNPALRASIDFAGRPRTLWLLHNVAPFDNRPGMPVGAEFDALATRIKAEHGSTIVMGDMNSTDGSPHFARFLRMSGLRDTRLGFGRQRSWPSWSFYQIAIDHAFVSDDLAVLDRRVGPMIGSDHFPVLLDLAPAEARPSTKEAANADHSSVDWGCSSANLDRSTILKKATRLAARSSPTRPARPGSAAISSVVLDAHDGP